MYNLPRTIKFFLVAYTLLPFVTDHFCSCVCVCQEHLKRRSGDAFLNTCMIRRTRSIFVRIQTASFSDWSLLFWLENMSRAGEEAFRQRIFEYMSQSIFLGPHTDSCLVWQTILFPVCICHGQLCQEHWKRRSEDSYLNTYMIRCAQSLFFGLIQTLAFSDRKFI